MRVLLTGGSSGLGKAIAQSLAVFNGMFEIIHWNKETGVNVARIASVQLAAARLEGKKLDILINCAGVNAIEFIPKLKEEEWDLLMDTNAKGIFLVTQAVLENLRGGTILNIISNASHVPMTSSLAYNASKGAAAIMTKQMARELGKTHNITVFGISPNKLAGTGMSSYIERRVCELRGWTPEQAKKYQLDALPAGEETDPATLAEFIAFLLSSKQRHKFLAGVDIPYGGP